MRVNGFKGVEQAQGRAVVLPPLDQGRAVLPAHQQAGFLEPFQLQLDAILPDHAGEFPPKAPVGVQAQLGRRFEHVVPKQVGCIKGDPRLVEEEQYQRPVALVHGHVGGARLANVGKAR